MYYEARDGTANTGTRIPQISVANLHRQQKCNYEVVPGVSQSLIGSPLSYLRAFQIAQDEHCKMSLSPPPQGGSKTQCPKFEQ